MRTPDGRDCPYYYADIQRWHEGEERCQLLENAPDAARWTSKLCKSCPVPEIKRANTCPNMVLHAKIKGSGVRFWKGPQMVITATCKQTQGPVENPYVGCGHCHKPLNFVVAEE